MVISRICASLVAFVLLFASARATAQGTEEQAEREFEAGKAADERGQPEEACQRYRASLKLSRVLGPLSRSARCDAREGHLLDAIAKLDELLASLPADHPKRAEHTAERAQWQARLARLTLTLKPGAPPVSATLDGKPAPPFGVARELDPGPHVVRIDCCGEPLEKVLDLPPGSSTPLALPFADPIGPVQPPTGPSTTEEGLSPWMVGAIISFTVAGGAIIGTAVTGALILDEDSAAQELCLPTRQPGCDDAIESGEALLAPNLALWIVSGVAVAAGVTFVIVDSTQSTSQDKPLGARATLRAAPGALVFTGSF